MIRAAALFAALAAPTAAGDDPTFPATDCAALWSATAAFRATYAIDRAPPAEAEAMAAAFREAALALGAGPAAALDRRIAELHRVYFVLLQRAILDGDREARDRHEGLAELCGAFAEARGLAGH
ncbi:hypothetical protein SAMN05444722_0908 [Rhodovulum sp. ES.010]|uniref:hypothetical protein n=1 Tax=Rhodovulum sp. ES.010 TaxID=1882821 RepID=UPI00092B026F|nr:hypothetical protein [Rhodovulum sp. ES.010]SIO22686.1 hypothetical protein SAMN05444722_0908 [Rhodovulum sp. ES.010]